MTRLVEQEVILHAGEFAGLQRKAFDGRNPGPGALACLRDELPEAHRATRSPRELRPSRVDARWPAGTPLRFASSRSVGISSRPWKSASLLWRGQAATPTERETSAHRGRPGIAGRRRAPTTSSWLSGSASRHGADDLPRRRPPAGRGTAAPPRAWSGGESIADARSF